MLSSNQQAPEAFRRNDRDILRALERHGGGAGEAPETRADDTATDEERAVLCAVCGSVVAHERDAMEVFGAHEHDRLNPGGYLFRIACFARAEGAVPIGDASTEFPWFPHHEWRIAICRGCTTQLGWHFASGASAFYGFIVDRIERR